MRRLKSENRIISKKGDLLKIYLINIKIESKYLQNTTKRYNFVESETKNKLFILPKHIQWKNIYSFWRHAH